MLIQQVLSIGVYPQPACVGPVCFTLSVAGTVRNPCLPSEVDFHAGDCQTQLVMDAVSSVYLTSSKSAHSVAPEDQSVGREVKSFHIPQKIAFVKGAGFGAG